MATVDNGLRTPNGAERNPALRNSDKYCRDLDLTIRNSEFVIKKPRWKAGLFLLASVRYNFEQKKTCCHGRRQVL
jgi:hypothetical protein